MRRNRQLYRGRKFRFLTWPWGNFAVRIRSSRVFAGIVPA